MKPYSFITRRKVCGAQFIGIVVSCHKKYIDYCNLEYFLLVSTNIRDEYPEL